MSWLPQRQPGDDVVLLQDYPTRVVHLDCLYCDRTARYGLVGLVRRFGPATELLDVLEALSADCPHRQNCRFTGPCGAGFPDLVPRPPS